MIHVLEREQLLPRALPEVFEFFAAAENLERITPPALAFRILSPLPIEMREGALIDYRMKLRGIPFRWRTRIALWKPGHSFVDEQLSGPYRSWVHTHWFEEGSAGTRCFDRVEYSLPLTPLGDIAYPFVRRELDGIFDYRHQAMSLLFDAER